LHVEVLVCDILLPLGGHPNILVYLHVHNDENRTILMEHTYYTLLSIILKRRAIPPRKTDNSRIQSNPEKQ
jgi:hypothetical protein